MGRFRYFGFVGLICALLACKKNTGLENSTINVQNLYVKFVTASRVDITYELSHLGYTETGVMFFKKANPLETTQVRAVRGEGTLKLSLQGLESNTEYVFKVFYKQNDIPNFDVRDYTVKTLSGTLAKYALQVTDTLINFDENGNFTADLVGDNLNNLNLSKLDIRLNNIPLKLDYPVLLNGGKYKMVVKGTVNPANANYAFQGLYNGQEILLQSVPFRIAGEQYWLTYKPTNLRGYDAAVFNNHLYYFSGGQVLTWDDSEERLSVVGNGSMPGAIKGHAGIQFEDQIFFSASEASSDDLVYPQAGSFLPGENTWNVFPLKNTVYSSGNQAITSSHLFIHKDELFLAFGIADNFGISTPRPPVNYLYRYNKTTKQFKEVTKPDKPIESYRYISINNELYLLGLVPVYDQGFEMSSTFGVYRVNDQSFEPEEIYRGGSVHSPLSFSPKFAVEHDKKILIAASLHDFLIFDPSSGQLSPVYLKNGISNMYFGGLFTYNNTLHLNADLFFNEATIYEISINKGK
ncbi:hypothetical protein GZH53_13455 [Flavihumibacter sp. R14]|nr:hypothetical protein [Flavihumibacter soli]